MARNPTQILLVADGPDVDGLPELLSGAGYQLLEARNLGRGLGLARNLLAPGLIVVDGQPKNELVSFLTQLRRLRPADFHALPVVLLSEVEGPVPAGVSEVVTKPWVAPLVLEVVQRLLEKS